MKMLALGENLSGSIGLSGNDRRDRQDPVTPPQSVAKHIRSHGVCFAEAAVNTLPFGPLVEDPVPIEDEGMNDV